MSVISAIKAKPAPGAGPSWRHSRTASIVLWTIHTIVLILSVLLIVYISYDTFTSRDFLANQNYMTFQLWVCMVFILSFFVELIFSDNKWRYVGHRFLFLLISVPYLNIVTHYNIPFSPEAMYFVRFIPLARGALALSIVFGYFSKNAITSLFMSYIIIMLMIVYFCSLIFFQFEQAVNPQVDTYWTSLWWAAMNMSTVGCYINPVTDTGRILAVVLPISGMIIFPL
ncbi:MAG: two pore domain potassium channel family protein, partial [Muribaculaceae bacterium]|nr:two pore domain potassium channel family protein [Muribaculaceae bacterium]